MARERIRNDVVRVAMMAFAFSTLGAGPCAMFPGGELDGVVAPVPDSWDFLGDGTQCDLEVNPPDPVSVHVDCYAVDGVLHVHSHRYARMKRWWGEAWVSAAERDARVRLLHDGKIYELRAARVTDGERRERVLLSRGFDPVPEGIELFEFGPRTSR